MAVRVAAMNSPVQELRGRHRFIPVGRHASRSFAARARSFASISNDPSSQADRRRRHRRDAFAPADKAKSFVRGAP